MASSVLVVDPSAENREVLRTVLHQRGMEFWEAGEARSGLALARQHHPDVIVLDLDDTEEGGGPDESQWRSQIDRERAALIVLGEPGRDSLLPANRVLSKPYHFAPLVHTIQELAAAARAA